MNGYRGLVIAVALGVAAAAMNWFYLARKAQEVESVSFLAISKNAKLSPGDRLREEDLVRVDVPKQWAGTLKDFAVPYTARSGVVQLPLWRADAAGTLLLEQDLITPPAELKIAENERVVFVPVDTRTFVPSLVKPGDLVSFLVSRTRAGVPTPAPTSEDGSASPDPSLSAGGPVEIIGPFKVLSLGNRLGQTPATQAARLTSGQENVMAIPVTVDASGNLAPDAQKLLRLLDETSFRPVSIMLHARGVGVRSEGSGES